MGMTMPTWASVGHCCLPPAAHPTVEHRGNSSWGAALWVSPSDTAPSRMLTGVHVTTLSYFEDLEYGTKIGEVLLQDEAVRDMTDT